MAGIPEQLLIISDQKGYVAYILAAIMTVANTIIQILLIRLNSSIVLVKLSGTIISVIQIALICFYVRKHYQLNRGIKLEVDPIHNKWDGAAQHIAYFVHENTDIILLTVFSSFQEVSVYSVYFMVISGVRRISASIIYSIQPKLGEIKARGNQTELNSFFNTFEKWNHICSMVVFGSLGVLLVPFVEAYTDGVIDTNYNRPLFAVLMVAAYGFQSVRDPYDRLILVSGHFRQTQKSYIIAASLNLGISMLAVQLWGLEGVAVGTLVAMIYQTIYMSIYDTKVLLKRPMNILFRRLILDAVMVFIVVMITMKMEHSAKALFQWVFGKG